MRMKEQAVLEGELANPSFMSAAQPEMLLLYRYLARSMIDGSPQAASMFDEMVALGETWLERSDPGRMADPRAYAALLVAMELGALSLHEQVSRALGADIFSPEGHLRLAAAKVDFYSKPLLGPELAAQAHAAIEQLRARAPGPARAAASRESSPWQAAEACRSSAQERLLTREVLPMASSNCAGGKLDQALRLRRRAQ